MLLKILGRKNMSRIEIMLVRKIPKFLRNHLFLEFSSKISAVDSLSAKIPDRDNFLKPKIDKF